METKHNDWDRERSHNPDMDEKLHKPINAEPLRDKTRDGTEEVAEPKPELKPEERWRDRGK